MHKTVKTLDKSASAGLALVGFPFDENSSFLKGAAKATPLIRKALHSDSSNLWSESGVNLGESSVIIDIGDISFSPGDDYQAKIEESISDLLGHGHKPISLGGDHSITYPIIKAFSKKHPNLTILQFDAHPDLYDEFQGNRYSHACPFARIMEEKLAGRLVQIGIRTSNGHQREQAARFGVETIEMREWRSEIDFPTQTALYVSFDMDVLDPAFAPGVSHHEPGGASVRQALEVIQSLSAHIVGADVVECNPDRDPQGITTMAAAKVLKEIMAKTLE